MYLKSIKIHYFRKIENLDIEFDKNINVFVGKNAQGKTSILDAIYVLALTKFDRNMDDSELINKNSLFSKIYGFVKIGNVTKKLDIVLEKNKKILKINNNLCNKVSSYISNLNVIMFNPDDLDIIKKSPSARRNLINVELCQLYPNYIKVLNEYNKILKIRNEYLRKNSNNIDKNYFDIITINLIDRAVLIMNYRKVFLDSINDYINDIYYKIMKQRNLSICYESNLPYYNRDDLIKYYNENYDNELYQKITLFGPHRDDFYFNFNDNNLKMFGSQGQQKGAVLAFKLSEINIFKDVKGYYPIVLLDDIFSEFDIEKRNNLFKFIKSNIQYFITTTDLNDISKKVLGKAKIFKIKDGKITR